MTTKFIILLSLTLAIHAYAGSATWNLNPATNDWNTATNWTPATIPNAITDIATFGASNTTSILTSAKVDLASLVFTAGAPSYIIATDHARDLTFWDEGVRNDSGGPQVLSGNFMFNGDSSAGDNVAYEGGRLSFHDNTSAGSASFDDTFVEFFDNASAADGVFDSSGLAFHNNSTAGRGMFSLVNGGGASFFDTSSAGDATFTLLGGGVVLNMVGGTLSNAMVTANGGASLDTQVSIQLSATADHATLIANGTVVPGMSTKSLVIFDGTTAPAATLIVNPTTVTGGTGGSLQFRSGASAGDSNITVNGAAIVGDIAEGLLIFSGGQNTTAANATIVATGGSNGGKGGLVQFLPNAKGDTCRIELTGNSQLEMAADRDLDLTIGSLEGEGTVTLGGHALSIGSNNLSTTFSGLIQDGTGVGGILKIGAGTLTLTGANTYTGGTTITRGVLLVSNAIGSGTGTGAVTVNGGTLGGSGIIAGAVTGGTNTNISSFLAPSKGSKRPATLAIQGALTLNDDSTYLYKLDTKHRVSDQILAQGVTIDDGAKFSLRASGTTQLPLGQVFTVISNTAASAIAGRFHNLADGAIVNVNGNNLQADYEGGDGNDLVLTVVP